jgi:hypothetical protein
MRFMAVVLMAAGVAVGSMAVAAAAPSNGVMLGRAAEADSLVSRIAYHRWHGRLCYTKCYREFVIGRRVCRRFC